MSLALARRLTSMLPTSWEYRARRGINLVLPVAHRAAIDNFYHVCVWRSASQWIRVVLSDPRIYRYGGLSVALADDHLRADPGATRFPRRRIVAALMRPYPYFAAIPKPERWRAMFVKRDPRDLLVSFYFSNRYSHPENPVVLEARRELANLSDRDGLLKTLDRFEPFIAILTSWQAAAATPGVLVARYEDLVGADRVEQWAAALAEADIRPPRATLEAVLRTYAFERITGGRSPGVEAPDQKYRCGLGGAWRRHFDDAVADAFRARFGDLVERLGYEW